MIGKRKVAGVLADGNHIDVDSLATVAEQLLQRKLEPLERFILQESWSKRTYAQMAQKSSYGSEYVKHVGFKLWSALSVALNETVSKKNLHLIFTAARFQTLLQDQVTLYPQRSSAQPKSLQAKPLSSEPFPPELSRVPLKDFTQAEAIAHKPSFDKLPDNLMVPSGPVPLRSPLYIERSPVEETAFSEISYPGCLLRIKASRRMGKSSLLNRLLAYSKTQGYQAVKLNLNEVDTDTFSSLDRFLRWFCVNLSLKLSLPSQVDAMWDEEIGSKVNCKLYMERYILSKMSQPLVLGIDELNRVFEHVPTAHDFLPMLRVWHEQSKDDPLWRNLRLVLVHATDFYVPLKLNQSPFNVGLSLMLPSFTIDQLRMLAQRYGLDVLLQGSGAWQLKSLHYLTDGHPYLAGLAFYALRRKQTTLNDILGTAATSNGIYRQHLQQCLATLQSDMTLACLYYQVAIADEAIALDAISAYKLESLGLIQFDNGLIKPSCDLYRRYFGEQLRSICT